MAWNIFTNGKQTLGLNLSERFSITDNALIDMKVKRVLCSIINQKWKDSSLNPQPLFTVAWHGRHENGPEWDNPDVQVQAAFPDQVQRSLKTSRAKYFFSGTETSDRGSVKKKKISRVSSTGTTGLRKSRLKKTCYFQIFSADGIFLNHLSQDIRGTNSSAVWRLF